MIGGLRLRSGSEAELRFLNECVGLLFSLACFGQSPAFFPHVTRWRVWLVFTGSGSGGRTNLSNLARQSRISLSSDCLNGQRVPQTLWCLAQRSAACVAISSLLACGPKKSLLNHVCCKKLNFTAFVEHWTVKWPQTVMQIHSHGG